MYSKDVYTQYLLHNGFDCSGVGWKVCVVKCQKIETITTNRLTAERQINSGY